LYPGEQSGGLDGPEEHAGAVPADTWMQVEARSSVVVQASALFGWVVDPIQRDDADVLVLGLTVSSA